MFLLRLLGGISLEGPSGSLTGRVVQRRRLALLARLAAARTTGCSRDKLVGYLWPESDEVVARHLLSDSVYVLRQALGEDSLLASGERLSLNPDVVSTDLAAFQAALEAEEFEQAVDLYGGPFLDGFHSGAGPEFDHWRDSESRRLADLYAQALESLAQRAEQSDDLVRAVLWWKRLAAHDPHNSRLALLLVEAMAAAGDRANALEYAKEHERLLREELGIEPDAEFMSVRKRLKESTLTKLAQEPAEVLEREVPKLEAAPLITQDRAAPRQRFTRRSAFNRAAIALALLAVIVASYLAYRGLGRRSTGRDFSLDRIAVLPFSYQGGEEYAQFANEGVVHLLTAALDGAGEMRVVDPHTVLPAADWEGAGSLDSERAVRIAARFGAGRYVMGNVAEAGGSLRITAWLYQRDTLAARASAEGEASELHRLVDDLALQLAVGAIGEDGARLAGIGARTTESLEALKVYLEGESHFRANRFAAAGKAFRQAVEIDSTFALAWFRLAAAAIWSWQWDLGHEASDRAVHYSQRLPPRERQLLMAWAAHMRGSADESERLYRAIVQRHPDDVEGWYGLGAVLYHHNILRGRFLSEAREPFLRALRYEPQHYRARALLMWTEAAEGRWLVADSLYRTFFAEPGLSWRAALASAKGERLALTRMVAEADTVSAGLQHWIAVTVAWTATDPRDGLEFARLLARATTGSPGLRTLGLTTVAHLELVGGHLQAAFAAIDTLASVNRAWALEHGALLAAAPFLDTPRDRLEALRDTVQLWRADAVPASHDPFFYVNVHDGIHAHLRLYLLGLASARLGDREAAGRYAGELERLAPPREAGTLAQDLAQGIRAQVAWVEGDAQQTLAALDAAPRQVRFERAWTSPFYSQSLERYLRGWALEATGRPHEALRWYATLSQHSVYDKVYLAPSHLRRAEIYERLGDRESAARHYARFIELWQGADPELQPRVAAGQRALDALSAEK